jgi:hypothetical protein
MPHLKCVGCRTRHRRAFIAVNSATEACPTCGADLEAVEDLAGLVGFRAADAPSDPVRELPEAVAVALHPPDSMP